jgi:hypothetical protein
MRVQGLEQAQRDLLPGGPARQVSVKFVPVKTPEQAPVRLHPMSGWQRQRIHTCLNEVSGKVATLVVGQPVLVVIRLARPVLLGKVRPGGDTREGHDGLAAWGACRFEAHSGVPQP